MTVNKASWRLLIPCCSIPEDHQQQQSLETEIPKLKKKRSIIRKQSSFQRLGLSDLSNPNSTTLSEDLSISLAGSNLFSFTLQELRLITQHFTSSNFLGEGGFGPVHKGFIDDKLRPGLKAQAVAVKLLDLDGSQGHREWLAEVIFLGQLRHPHLVKLIGYCCEDEHRLLVYEYMPRGSLENQLFRRFTASLPWLTRIKIAVGAAKGLAFLHEAEKPVIYRDFKASNILLDSDFTAKLSDFGLAKDGPEGDDTHVSTRVMGTQGYAAPEYIMTGHLTAASDVYSFGVVLLELLTGRRSMDKSRGQREQNLAEWARPQLMNVKRLNRMMDPKLEGQYSEIGAQKAAALAYQCLSLRPKNRPTMSVVVKTLEALRSLDDDIPVGTFVYTVPAMNGGGGPGGGGGGGHQRQSSNSPPQQNGNGNHHRNGGSAADSPAHHRYHGSNGGTNSPAHHRYHGSNGGTNSPAHHRQVSNNGSLSADSPVHRRRKSRHSGEKTRSSGSPRSSSTVYSSSDPNIVKNLKNGSNSPMHIKARGA